jgi:hypothetical protein
MGLAAKVVLLGCIPLGAIGAARLVRSIGSQRGRLVAGIVYLLVPLPYDALATGRMEGLIGYAAAPWILAGLARASGAVPFGRLRREDDRDAGSGDEDEVAPTRLAVARQVLWLGLVGALAGALAPATLLMIPVATAGLALGGLLGGGPGAIMSSRRLAWVGALATVTTVLLLAPWSIHLIAGQYRLAELGTAALEPASAPSWGSLLHLGIGPLGDTPLAWGIPIAAALAILIATGWRFSWATRAWTVALLAFGIAWLSGRGWLGGFAASQSVMVAIAAAALAFSVGLGVASFEKDLSAYRFGWRQAATAVAGLFLVLGILPSLASMETGRFDLPSVGYRQALSWLDRPPASSGRVLWLGDPRVLLGESWPIRPGLAYSLSGGGMPGPGSLWPGSSPGTSSALVDDIGLAESGSTVRLGALMAPYQIRYVVVVQSAAPAIPGLQQPQVFASESTTVQALRAQSDLRELVGEGGYVVFADPTSPPLVVSGASDAGASVSTALESSLEILAWAALLAALLVLRRARPDADTRRVP